MKGKPNKSNRKITCFIYFFFLYYLRIHIYFSIGACKDSHRRQTISMPILPQEIFPLWILLVPHDIEKVPKQIDNLGGCWHNLNYTSIAPGTCSTFRIGYNHCLRLSFSAASTSFDSKAHTPRLYGLECICRKQPRYSGLSCNSVFFADYHTSDVS